MKGWIKTGNFPSSILLVGESGSGKTTIAKMLSRYINCKTMNSCGKCSYCRYKEDMPDVQLINCGQTSTVDEMRNLLVGIDLAPRYRKRIYILDEVHLLADKAMQTLLIPLETPPADTMWVLCTTEDHKIKDTIRNRCSTLYMKPIPVPILTKRLEEIVARESDIKVKPKLLNKTLATISDFSGGQARKAISDLDTFLNAVRSGDAEVSPESFMSMYEEKVGADVDSLAVSLLIYILGSDLESFVCIVDKVGNNSKLLITKFNMLIQWLIKSEAGAAKWTPYLGKLYEKALANPKTKKLDLRYNLALLLKIAHTAQRIDHTILTVPGIRADQFLMTTFAELLIDEVYKEMVNLARPSKKKK
jgi:DNA polymerase-3 subunit gamma/tau